MQRDRRFQSTRAIVGFGVLMALVIAGASACERPPSSGGTPAPVAAPSRDPASEPQPPPPSVTETPPTAAPAPPTAAPAPPPTPPTAAPAPPVAPSNTDAPADTPTGVRVFTERWPDGSIVREYQMRRGKDGKYRKNGWFRAYFGDGKLEREGTYRDDQRVGVWKIYNHDGSVAQTSDFGEGRPPMGPRPPATPPTGPSDESSAAPVARPSSGS